MIKRLGIRNIARLLNPLWNTLSNVWNGELFYTSLDTNVVAAYNAENNANDSKGSNHGTFVNGATTIAGKIGNAFSTNGTSYVQLPNNSLNFTGDFSISLWVDIAYIGSWSAKMYPIHNLTYENGNYYGYSMYIVGNQYTFYIGNGTPTLETLLFNCGGSIQAQIAPYAGDRWKHVVVTRKSGVGTKLYVGGNPITDSQNLKVSNTSTANPVYTTTHTPYIGRYSNVTTNVDGLTFWDRELTSLEISRLYNYTSITYYGNTNGTYYYKGNGLQYPFSSSYGSSSADLVGASNGTLMNGATFTTGKVGNAFTFDGVNDYITLPTNSIVLNKFSLGSLGSVVGQYETYGRPAIGSTTIDGANDYIGVDYSISLWVYLTDVTSPQMIIGSYDGQGSGYNYGWGMWLSSGNIGQYEYYGSGQYNANTPITANAWHHVVVTRKAPLKDGSDNGSIKLYIDNVLVATTNPPTNHSIRMVQFPSVSTIGCSRWGSGTGPGAPNYFMKNGSKLDAITIWEREITEAEVTELYNSGNGKQYAPLN